MPTTKVPASRMVDHNIGSYCFRNKIINGDMRIDQRNNGAVSTNTLGNFTYSVDRWCVGSDTATTTSQRITDPTTGLYSLRVTGATGNTAISFNQRIESSNSLELVNKTVNLSFDSFANTGTTLQWILAYPNTQDNFTAVTALSSGTVNVTTRTTFNTGPITLDNNVSRGLLVRFVVLNHTAGRTIDLTNVQLEVGPIATPFEYRPIGTELALCQRYYCREGLMTGQSTLLNRAMCYTGSASIFFSSKYPVTMRTGPRVLVNLDITDGTPFTYDSNVNTQPNAGGVNSTSTDRFFVYQYSGMTAGQFVDLNGYTADAEL